MVTGHGTGFVMCWQNGVKWSINQHEDPKKFMTVNSGNYVLAIPDLTRFAKGNDNDGFVRSGNASIDSRRQLPAFRKVIMKLSGNVQWLAGLVFERDTGNGERSFKFKPHYDVVLKNPDFARSCNELVCKSKSSYFKLSIGLTSIGIRCFQRISKQSHSSLYCSCGPSRSRLDGDQFKYIKQLQ